MSQKKLSVSIGLAVYNEEQNIYNLLAMVLKQRELGWSLKEIMVISDGSTDETVNEVRRIKSRKVHIMADKKRKGQNKRYNEILKRFTGDIIVLLEGDTLLNDTQFISHLIQPLANDTKLSASFADSLPLLHKNMNLLERSLYEMEIIKNNQIKKLDKENNLYLLGSAKAIRKTVAKKLQFPQNVPEDSWVYLYAISNNLRLKFQPNATVFFRLPSNIKDYILKSNKYRKSTDGLSNYLPAQLVKKEYSVSFDLKLKIVWEYLGRAAYLFPLYISLNLISYIYSLFQKGFNPVWEISKSTKRLEV